MITPELAFALAAGVAAFCVGMGKGGVPMIGTLAVPVMALVMSPIAAAGLLLPVYVVSDMFGVWAYRREYSRRVLAIVIPAATFGIAIGWGTASFVTDAMVMAIVGVIGIAFCLARWFGGAGKEARPADVPRGVFWGTVSGFTSFVTHGGGPPYQMYAVPLKLPKMVYAGTTTIAFAAINAIKLVPYWSLGQLNPANLKVTLALMPVAIVGTYAGVHVTRVIPERHFYRLVVGALFLLSLKLVYDGFRELAGF